MGLSAAILRPEFGTGWLIAATVVWLVAALGFCLLYLMLSIAPQGGSEIGNYVLYPRWYDAGGVLTVYVVPVALGALTHAAGFSSWWFALYLFPHGVTLALLTVLVGNMFRRRWRRSRPTGG